MGCMNESIMPAKITKIEKPARGPVWGLGAGQSALEGGGGRRGSAPDSDLLVDKSHQLGFAQGTYLGGG